MKKVALGVYAELIELIEFIELVAFVEFVELIVAGKSVAMRLSG